MIHQLVYDTTADDADNHSVGAYVRSSDGTLIDHKTLDSAEWLNTASATYSGDGATAISATGTSLDVNVTNTLGIDVDLDHTEDNVQLGDGTTLITGTTVGSDHGLDVYNLNDPARANTDFAVAQNSVTTTSESIVASALSGRKRLLIANEGNRKLYIGKTTATTSDFPIAPGAMLDLIVGDAIDLKGITSTGTADVRTLELS